MHSNIIHDPIISFSSSNVININLHVISILANKFVRHNFVLLLDFMIFRFSEK